MSTSPPPAYKLGRYEPGKGVVGHRHGTGWRREPDRIVVAPQGDGVEWVRRLANLAAPPLSLKGVLIEKCEPFPPGVYLLRSRLSLESLDRFLNDHAKLIGGDARMDLHVEGSQGTIEYDQHDLISFRGPLDEAAQLLTRLGVPERDVSLPWPHTHHQHDCFDETFRSLLAEASWLQPLPLPV